MEHFRKWYSWKSPPAHFIAHWGIYMACVTPGWWDFDNVMTWGWQFNFTYCKSANRSPLQSSHLSCHTPIPTWSANPYVLPRLKLIHSAHGCSVFIPASLSRLWEIILRAMDITSYKFRGIESLRTRLDPTSEIRNSRCRRQYLLFLTPHFVQIDRTCA